MFKENINIVKITLWIFSVFLVCLSDILNTPTPKGWSVLGNIAQVTIFTECTTISMFPFSKAEDCLLLETRLGFRKRDDLNLLPVKNLNVH